MATFTPSDAVDMSKERDWPSSLGMLDWDSTSIVFTKRSLLEFLKYAGVTVDPDFRNIQKLPRYAQFGKIGNATADIPASPELSHSASSTTTTDAYRPARRPVAPQENSAARLFGITETEDSALSAAPPPPEPAVASQTAAAPPPVAAPAPDTTPAESVRQKSKRTTSSIASLWDAPDEQEFKPTRRVRETPGGRDNISGIFGS